MSAFGIDAIQGALAGGASPARAAGGGDGSFGELLKGLVEDANANHARSDQMVESLAKGEPTDVHQVMLAMTEADLSFRMLLEVRNRLVDAYQEIQRMPV